MDVGVFCRCVYWDWTPELCILIGCGFCSGFLSTEERHFLDEGLKATFMCVYVGNAYRLLYWLSKMVIIDSSPITMTSLTLIS